MANTSSKASQDAGSAPSTAPSEVSKLQRDVSKADTAAARAHAELARAQRVIPVVTEIEDTERTPVNGEVRLVSPAGSVVYVPQDRVQVLETQGYTSG